jgi:hypothetical protein
VWHGNVFRSLHTADDLAMDLEDGDASVELDKLAKAVRESGGYLAANASAIPNYGGAPPRRRGHLHRVREIRVNQVVSKRMVKKQQMRWSPRGAHLLLQIRTRVPDDTLAHDYRRWYPDFTHTPDRQDRAA